MAYTYEWNPGRRHNPIYSGKKLIRLIIFITVSTSFLTTFALLIGLTIFDSQHNHIVQDYVARSDDVAILSTTLFANSKSYPPNTAVILFNAAQVFHLKHVHLNVLTESIRTTDVVPFKISPVIGQMPFFCKWAPFIAIGQVPADVVSLRLAPGTNSKELKLRKPYKSLHDVVVCFSPLFLNERWQLLLSSLEIYSYYGAFMHFYVRSMMTDLMTLLRSYKKTRVTPWPSVRLGKTRASSQRFDPNMELEFRNQAAAMTDCLLMYKDSADFIFFPDLDDIVIPHVGNSYYDEFTSAFALFPEAGAISYNMSQAHLISTTSPSNYSPLMHLNSVRPNLKKDDIRWGKLVVKPDRLDSIWIHKSYGLRSPYVQKWMPIEKNSALHFRHWTFKHSHHFNRTKENFYTPENANGTLQRIYEVADGIKIDKNFRSRMLQDDFYEVYSRLPSASLYYPLIEKCYNRIFYNNQHHSTCKGPEYCDIPEFPGLRCTNVISDYSSYPGYSNLYIHHLDEAHFEDSENGCTL